MPRLKLPMHVRNSLRPCDKRRTHEKQTREDPQPQRGAQRYDDFRKDRVRKEGAEGNTPIIIRNALNPLDRQEERGKGHVSRDNREPYKCSRVSPLAALWTISQSQDETHEEEAKVEVVEDDIDDIDTGEIVAVVLQGVGQDGESDVIVCL